MLAACSREHRVTVPVATPVVCVWRETTLSSRSNTSHPLWVATPVIPPRFSPAPSSITRAWSPGPAPHATTAVPQVVSRQPTRSPRLHATPVTRRWPGCQRPRWTIRALLLQPFVRTATMAQRPPARTPIMFPARPTAQAATRVLLAVGCRPSCMPMCQLAQGVPLATTAPWRRRSRPRIWPPPLVARVAISRPPSGPAPRPTTAR